MSDDNDYTTEQLRWGYKPKEPLSQILPLTSAELHGNKWVQSKDVMTAFLVQMLKYPLWEGCEEVLHSTTVSLPHLPQLPLLYKPNTQDLCNWSESPL